MKKLPIISGKKFVAFFEKHGFKRKSQKGSHITLKKSGISRRIVIPDHKELSTAVVKRNLTTASISEQDFIQAMQKPKKKSKPTSQRKI